MPIKHYIKNQKYYKFIPHKCYKT